MQNFIGSLLFTILLPWLPVGVEYFGKGLQRSTLAMASAMFVLSIAVATKIQWLFFFSIFAGIVLIAAVGVVSSDSAANVFDWRDLAFPAFVGLAHTVERVSRHVLGAEAFLDFVGAQKRSVFGRPLDS